ncbi:small basic family protein [Salisediminibacterium halotolerans]|uniref:Small basic protein n=1 Tax=Salisediminibacterium halotolerans TaxID=517425 RepID=A0A1H9PV57_9BACI|nr:DUF1290 domain-containing protein [Salisediminibacterium haloalkalitolerans]SER52166.1 Small basic protein [Salisediminibacterium haloalkalitolerans]
MWIPIAAVCLGLIAGYLFYAPFEYIYSGYLAVFLLVSLDTILGGIRSYQENTFDEQNFLSGFVINLIFASGIAFLGLQLGVDLYLAAVFALGVRLFRNLSIIRWHVTDRLKKQKTDH